jgi:hypothetical protein
MGNGFIVVKESQKKTGEKEEKKKFLKAEIAFTYFCSINLGQGDQRSLWKKSPKMLPNLLFVTFDT